MAKTKRMDLNFLVASPVQPPAFDPFSLVVRITPVSYHSPAYLQFLVTSSGAAGPFFDSSKYIPVIWLIARLQEPCWVTLRGFSLLPTLTPSSCHHHFFDWDKSFEGDWESTSSRKIFKIRSGSQSKCMGLNKSVLNGTCNSTCTETRPRKPSSLKASRGIPVWRMNEMSSNASRIRLPTYDH